MSLAKRIPAAMVQEGLIEEFTQSAQETIMQNLAEGKPWSQGVLRSGVEGALAGAAMGGGFQALASQGQPQVPPPGAMTPEQQAAANAANAGADQSLADYAGLAPELPAIAAVPSVIVHLRPRVCLRPPQTPLVTPPTAARPRVLPLPVSTCPGRS